ncbi:hypothetical protein Peur_056805 [Populus x canadensis]
MIRLYTKPCEDAHSHVPNQLTLPLSEDSYILRAAHRGSNILFLPGRFMHNKARIGLVPSQQEKRSVRRKTSCRGIKVIDSHVALF